jgi:hypothetical protein
LTPSNANIGKKEDADLRKGGWWIVAAVGLAWLIIGAGDWYMRFHWFRWHLNFLVARDAPGAGPAPSMQVLTHAEVRGGDLTRLIAIPSAAAPYEAVRPAATNLTDEFGFLNVPPTEGRRYPIVVAGDSYMTEGASMETTFSGWLQSISGVPVYNHASAGRGSFWSLLRFLFSERFSSREPDVLIWNILEREVSAGYYEGLMFRIYKETHGERAADRRIGSPLAPLRPAALKTDLPNTSALAQLSRRVWNQVRYRVFGEFNPIVVRATDNSMLFYRHSLNALRWPDHVKRVPQVADVLVRVNDMCRARNIALVIVMIPAKERVHVDLLPPDCVSKDNPLPPSTLDQLEVELNARGIRAVNLLPVFQAATREGHRLYWPDDSHWDQDGIQLAARVVWERIAPLLAERAGKAPGNATPAAPRPATGEAERVR